MPRLPAKPAITFRHDPFSRRALTRMALGAVVVVLVGVALGALVSAASPLPAEQQALEAASAARSPATTAALVLVSRLGNLEVMAVAALLAVPFLRWLTRGWEAPWLLGLVLLGSLFVTGVVKVVVGRERPVDALVEATTAAFPSGHASRAAAVLGLAVWAVLALTRRVLVRALLAGLLVAAVVAMGWSRVALGAHWPSDVAFGWGVGVWWLFVLLHAVQPRAVPAAAVGADEPQVAHP